jgi:hypothetical protein
MTCYILLQTGDRIIKEAGDGFLLLTDCVVPAGGGGQQGLPPGFGTGMRHRIQGQRHDDIKINRRGKKKYTNLEIQEIDRHDIMLFVKTFRQYIK